jgi:ABC-type phosphate/phosphonate transport system substrate-binding protein
MLVVRADDPAESLAGLRGRRVACNARDSHSGHNALRAAVAPLAAGGRFFADHVITGAHGKSADAVAAGAADLCAIDCVSWALLERYEPERIARLRVLGRTAPAPGLPLVTGLDAPLAAVRAAVIAVSGDPALAAAREALLLDGIEVLDEADYEAILDMERQAVAVGYPALD